MIDSADLAEITIGLGANEVLGGDRDGIACPRLRLSSVDKSQRRQPADDKLGLHVLFLLSCSDTPLKRRSLSPAPSYPR